MAKGKGFIHEFKQFILRGNVMDLAVGVIIGGAFQKIISSLVDDIIMPVISLLTGGIDFTNWFIPLQGGSFKTLAAAKEAGAATLNYGTFLTVLINFLIMAFVIFAIIKGLNSLESKVAHKKEVPVVPTTKVCPYCLSEIPIEASKCAHCTSVLEIAKKEEAEIPVIAE